MKKIFEILSLALLCVQVCSHNKAAIPAGTQVFGQWLFIYDGASLSPGKGLFGGVPHWIKNGGKHHPIELEKSASIPKQFEDALNEIKDVNIHVQFSVGGYDLAHNFRATDPVKCAQNAALITQKYGVGFEVDCEDGGATDWIGKFISAYRQSIAVGGIGMSSILTMDVGLSKGAFPTLDAVAMTNIDKLDWVNVMVGGWDSSDISQFWNGHAFPAEKQTGGMITMTQCNSYSTLKWCLSYKKAGKPIKGILSWAALSEQTCDKAPQTAYACNTHCTDCTGGVKTNGVYTCPAYKQACSEYLGASACSSTSTQVLE